MIDLGGNADGFYSLSDDIICFKSSIGKLSTLHQLHSVRLSKKERLARTVRQNLKSKLVAHLSSKLVTNIDVNFHIKSYVLIHKPDYI